MLSVETDRFRSARKRSLIRFCVYFLFVCLFFSWSYVLAETKETKSRCFQPCIACSWSSDFFFFLGGGRERESKRDRDRQRQRQKDTEREMNERKRETKRQR